MRRCYCCDREFTPKRSRRLCDPCDYGVSRFASKTAAQLDEIERRAEMTLARCRIAREWHRDDPIDSRI